MSAMANTVRFTPLSDPLMAGLELMTLNRYNPLVTSVEGSVQEIVPPETLATVPIVTGLPPKLPVGSEICAEKMFGDGVFEKVPETV